LRLELYWVLCQFLLKFGIRAKIVLFVNFKASFVKSAHRGVLNPCDDKCVSFVVPLTEQDARFCEKCVRIGILKLVTDKHFNGIGLVFEVPKCVLFLG
jgi:hypothetical protein